jgi:hypothetical protein
VKLRNTLAFVSPANKNILISPHPAKLPTGGMKCKGYMNEAIVFCFLGGASALTFHPPCAIGA